MTNTCDLYADIGTMKDHIDLAECPYISPVIDPQNNTLGGKMEEVNEQPKVEFVGLRAMMDSVLLASAKEGGLIEVSCKYRC